MKIFNKFGKFPDKVNFVDDNNVFVGYSLDQHCCETAGYFISTNKWTAFSSMKLLEKMDQSNNSKIISDWDDYYFDIDCVPEKIQAPLTGYGDGVDIVIFPLRNKGNTVYLHLFNSHNGYYSHGFNFGMDEDILISDSI